jgi:hypothetical protein
MEKYLLYYVHAGASGRVDGFKFRSAAGTCCAVKQIID